MTNTPETSTSKFKKFAVPGALVVGGITAGSFLAPIGLASAQESTEADTESTESTEAETTDSTDADSTDSTDSTEDRKERRGGRFGRVNGGERSELLTETLGLTAEEIRQGFEDGKSLADLATEQGVDVADLQAAMVAEASERLDEAVEAGKIDADEVAERLADIETKIEERINANPEDFEARTGRGGKGFRGGKLAGNAEALEEVLGLTGEEIRAGMVEGKSLSDLAAEQGVSVEDLAAVLTSGLEERIDEAVEAGKIDADRAAEFKDSIDEQVDSIITREFDGERAEGRQGKRGFRGNRGFRGAPADSADTNGEVVESSFSA